MGNFSFELHSQKRSKRTLRSNVGSICAGLLISLGANAQDSPPAQELPKKLWAGIQILDQNIGKISGSISGKTSNVGTIQPLITLTYRSSIQNNDRLRFINFSWITPYPSADVDQQNSTFFLGTSAQLGYAFGKFEPRLGLNYQGRFIWGDSTLITQRNGNSQTQFWSAGESVLIHTFYPDLGLDFQFTDRICLSFDFGVLGALSKLRRTFQIGLGGSYAFF